jgi:hypothetical protein
LARRRVPAVRHHHPPGPFGLSPSRRLEVPAPLELLLPTARGRDLFRPWAARPAAGAPLPAARSATTKFVEKQCSHRKYRASTPRNSTTPVALHLSHGMLRRVLAVRLHLHYRSDTTLRVACREPTAYATVRLSNGVFCTPTALTGTGAPERALCGGKCHSRERSSPPVRRHVARLAYRRLTTPPRCAEGRERQRAGAPARANPTCRH